MRFSFGEYKSNVQICSEIPDISRIAADFGLDINKNSFKPLLIADENTFFIAEKICKNKDFPICVLKSGEENKNWQSVQVILEKAHNESLGRDGIFIAVGGGVIGDIAAFASSIYKRGCNLAIVSTTLLAMVDASVGGKTGFDLFEIKNLIGTFYPAYNIYMPLDALSSLPEIEFKSGMAELLKTAVLSGDNFINTLEPLSSCFTSYKELLQNACFLDCIKKAVMYKGCIVNKDLRETGKRKLLNLGHTFGHALESTIGLGKITHGEAVAWGMIQACRLGIELKITPEKRAQKIINLLTMFGYTNNYNKLISDKIDFYIETMKNDKKKKSGCLSFIIPDKTSARIVDLKTDTEINTVIKILRDIS